MFGRCANRNSTRRCAVGTILAGDDAAYGGLRWSSHFASSDTTGRIKMKMKNGGGSLCPWRESHSLGVAGCAHASVLGVRL